MDLNYIKIVKIYNKDKLEAIEEKNRKLLKKLIQISTTVNKNTTNNQL